MDPLVDLLGFLFTEQDIAFTVRVWDCARRWGEAEGQRVGVQEVVLDGTDGLVEDVVDGVDYVIYEGLGED